MSSLDGIVLAYARIAPTGGEKERREFTGQGLRFTSLLSREASNPLKRTRDDMRIRSAICFPGWNRG
jgi:hypothetical protein